ncbi:MAG: AI-2E family transporter, partial [Pseudomonadota bacterium]|nr:AI-2E family transporter [Pseudomonadota bacterium]
ASGERLAQRLTLIVHRIAGDRAERLIIVTGATVRGVVYGILGTAVMQGFLVALGLWLVDVPHPVLLGAAAGFLAVFPVGAPLVWVPCAIWLASNGALARGIFLAAYGLLAVSGLDSVARPWFIARGAELPFLLTVLGVLGGALAFGFPGIFLGPVLLGVGYTLVNEWSGETLPVLTGEDPRP